MGTTATRLEFAQGSLDKASSSRVAWNLYKDAGPEHQGSKIGVFVAANSGRPGGAVYAHWGRTVESRLRNVHAGHKTQEECVVSAWLVSEAGASPNELSIKDSARKAAFERMDVLFKTHLLDKWGMVFNDDQLWMQQKQQLLGEGAASAANRSEWPEELKQLYLRTKQGVDYTNTHVARDYADAWVLDNASLCTDLQSSPCSQRRHFEVGNVVPVALVFISGPNANPKNSGHELSAMGRTTNIRCLEGDWNFFVDSIRWALRAGLDAAIEAGVNICVLARISGGIYAGKFRHNMTKRFYQRLVDGLLEEHITVPMSKAGETCSIVRGQFFQRVIMPWIHDAPPVGVVQTPSDQGCIEGHAQKDSPRETPPTPPTTKPPPPADFLEELPPEISESYYYLGDQQRSVILEKFNSLHHYVPHLPGWIPWRKVATALGYGFSAIEAAEAKIGRPFIWATEFENVHATWTFDEPGFVFQGKEFAGSEQLYQLCKAGPPGSLEYEKSAPQFQRPCNEMEAYEKGQQLALREHWHSSEKYGAMRVALQCKFSQSATLAALLISTRQHPLVSIKSDTCWGLGFRGSGQNNLGKLLVELRNSMMEKQ